jgi:hypothetical protein
MLCVVKGGVVAAVASLLSAHRRLDLRIPHPSTPHGRNHHAYFDAPPCLLRYKVHVNIPRLSKADVSQASDSPTGERDADPACSCGEEIAMLREANADLVVRTSELLTAVSVAEARNRELFAALQTADADRARLAADLGAAQRESERLRDMVAAGGALATVARENMEETAAALRDEEIENRRMHAQLIELRERLSLVRLQPYDEAQALSGGQPHQA